MSFLHPKDLERERQRVQARRQGMVAFFRSKNATADEADFSHLFHDFYSDDELEKIGQRNCQNLIGGVCVPLGVAGPVPVQIEQEYGEQSRAEFLLPLATTEGALVASAQRGCKAIAAAGLATVLTKYQGITRAPVFGCASGAAARRAKEWLFTQGKIFQTAAEKVSSHLEYFGMMGWVEGRNVFARLCFHSDQAMGMNMATIATQQAVDELVKLAPPELGLRLIAVSSNMCSDKKVAVINQVLGRGWWVQAEVVLSAEILRDVLKTSAKKFLDVHSAKIVQGSRLAGSASANMQLANMAAAFFLATGQDLAHVVDVSSGSTVIEPEGDGVYVAVTLPTVPVGVVGGGTWLPTQREARLLMTGRAELTAGELAAGLGVACLAGEISGLAALASHDLAKAHQDLGRAAK